MTTVRIVPLRFLAVLIIAGALPLTALGQAPSISTQPENVSIHSGSNAAMNVTANGAAPLSYQWRFFGANLAGRTNATLAITNVSITNGGVYTVVVTNSFGAVTSAPVLFSVDEHLTFRILQLQTNGAQAIECGTLTGDDRGGLAVSPESVFLTGDSSTARFSAFDLSGGTGLGRVLDSLCNNLRTEKMYLLANGTNIIAFGGTVNALLELDDETGLPNGTRISLSTNISMFSGAIFSGYDRIVLLSGNNAYDIALPSGKVTFRGFVPNLQRSGSESWVSWGLAEYFANTLYLVYVEGGAFPYTNIARIRVAPDSISTSVASFTGANGLGDMASIGFSISRSRWYFHHEGFSQFRSSGGPDETIGSAKALFSTNGGAPFIYQNPQAQVAYPGDVVTLNVVALGNGPFSYQWRSNGVAIAAPDSPMLVLSNVNLTTTANYSVVVGNAAGAVSSSEAFLFIAGAPQILVEPQTQSALAGTNMSFNVVVQAAPPISYQWLHDSTNVPNATNSTLAIPVVTTADVGDYIVIATNRYGSATSVVARLVLIVESAFNFKILGLSNDAVIAETEPLTGENFGGLAVSSNRVFVTGINNSIGGVTASLAADDLSGGVVLANPLFALVSDLRTERIYSLATGTNLFLTTTSTVA
ncbi:MAG TPA: immunoglobulin domain-containing protein, partial [Methylomirabilota bacterium]|nr:immunoglobulin domain-containing protein [Methylomirabilota bacterium]